MREEKPNAYMTVEAGMVLPLVVGVFVFLFSMLVFRYDRCLLEQDMAMIALWGATAQLDETEDVREEIQERLREIYWDKYVLWDPEELRAEIKYHRFFASAAGQTAFGKEWAIKADYNYEIYDPVSFIRGVENLTDH